MTYLRRILFPLLIVAFLVCCIPPTQIPYSNYVFPEGSWAAKAYNYRVEVEVNPDVTRYLQINNGGQASSGHYGGFGDFYCLNLVFVLFNDGRHHLYLVPFIRVDKGCWITSLTIAYDTGKRTYEWDYRDRETGLIPAIQDWHDDEPAPDTYFEWVFIDFPIEDLESFLTSERLSAKLHGTKYNHAIEFMDYIKANWQSFYDKYIKSIVSEGVM